MLPQLVAALAACTQAAPEAEADPALLYSTGHVLPYAYGAYPYVLPYAPLAAGCTNNDGSKCLTPPGATQLQVDILTPHF